MYLVTITLIFLDSVNPLHVIIFIHELGVYCIAKTVWKLWKEISQRYRDVEYVCLEDNNVVITLLGGSSRKNSTSEVDRMGKVVGDLFMAPKTVAACGSISFEFQRMWCISHLFV